MALIQMPMAHISLIIHFYSYFNYILKKFQKIKKEDWHNFGQPSFLIQMI